MKAVAAISSFYVDIDTPPDEATFIIDFCATEDPRSGQVTSNVALTQNEAQIVVALKQAVMDFINTQRGSPVIAVSDIRLP
jgi:hypothetical protein